RAPGIPPADALALTVDDLGGADFAITNPPWTRSLLHPLIVHLSELAPTWLLIDANWVWTRQAAPLWPRLREVAPIGRVRWIPDSPHTSKDDAAWMLFGRPADTLPRLHSRLAQSAEARP